MADVPSVYMGKINRIACDMERQKNMQSKQRKSILSTIIIFTAIVCVALAVSAFAASYDSSEDPLISLSYLTETFRPSIEKDYKERIAALEEQIASLQSALSNGSASVSSGSSEENGESGEADAAIVPQGYEVIELKYGDCLFAASACDIMLRAGSAFCIAPDATQGISDYTAGEEILNGEFLTKNHMCLIPRGDGRGIMATAQSVYIIVRGEYTIYEAE